MASLNKVVRSAPIFTHEGLKAMKINPEQQLRRSVLSCLLWENTFYESGEDIATRISNIAAQCDPLFVYNLAMEARHVHGLRHVPLLLLIDLIKRKNYVVTGKEGEEGFIKVKHAIANVIRRPDELMELVSLYWKDKKKNGVKVPVKMSDRQLRDGLALAFDKFDEYSLAKYDNQGREVKLRDVLFLSHAKPKNEERAKLYKKIAEKKLVTPDTWETAISAAGSDQEKKKAEWQRLLDNTLNMDHKERDGRLGYMALLRNLRNMLQVGLNRAQIGAAVVARRDSQLVLPFRYIAAARAAKELEPFIDTAFQASVKELIPLKGTTAVLVDVSGSMDSPLSSKSDLTRIDAACALAVLIQGDKRIFSFSDRTVEVPARAGMAGIDAIKDSQRHSSTRMSEAINFVNANVKHDRLIVISDEQAMATGQGRGNRYGYGYATGGTLPKPKAELPYMINVASYENGVGYGEWLHLDGFSEGIIKFIQIMEAEYFDVIQTEVTQKTVEGVK